MLSVVTSYVYISVHHVYAGCMYDACGLLSYYMCITSFINTLQRNFCYTQYEVYCQASLRCVKQVQPV